MIRIGYNNSIKHYGSSTHLEKPERTSYCIENLKAIYPNDYFINVSEVQTDYQEQKELALSIIKQVHSPSYLARIEGFKTNFLICRKCEKQTVITTRRTFDDFITDYPKCEVFDDIFNMDNMYCYASIDTYFTSHTYQIAMEGVMVLLKLLNQMSTYNLNSSWGIIRPPGHHCNNDPNGFCVFNNVVIAAHQAQKLGWAKVLILDVDFHHGDGTQQLLEKIDDPDISFVSIHGHGQNIYPGTGKYSNLDTNILNIPISIGLDEKSRSYVTDEFYQNLLVNQAFPFVHEQNPDFIIVSLGFDAHRDDPLEGLNITDSTYLFLASELRKINKPVLFVLEGGYNVTTVARLMAQMIKIFEN